MSKKYTLPLQDVFEIAAEAIAMNEGITGDPDVIVDVQEIGEAGEPVCIFHFVEGPPEGTTLN